MSDAAPIKVTKRQWAAPLAAAAILLTGLVVVACASFNPAALPEARQLADDVSAGI
jgi:hypothetical protein